MSERVFTSGSTALVRAVAGPAPSLPPLPDLADTTPAGAASQAVWLQAVWETEGVSEGLRHASLVLASQVRSLCEAEKPAERDVRRAVMSVARYLLRAANRPTPFGLFAGVTTASIGTAARADWRTEHWAVVGASAEWLSAIVTRLEECPELLARLPVVVNSCLLHRGERLIVPYQQDKRARGAAAVEVSVLRTAPVSAVLAAAGTPIRTDDLAAKIVAEFPAAGPRKVAGLLTELISRRVLITALHAPSTETDVLSHVLKQLDAADAENVPTIAAVVSELQEIQSDLTDCNTRPAEQARSAREALAGRMGALVPVRRHPLAVDLRLDATIALPHDVTREVERAALVLARLSAAPYGTAVWKEYHQRFYERFGIGSMVPVSEVVADSGIGFPDGYPGCTTGERRPRVSPRDEALVRIAQSAALDGRDEVVLDEELVASLQQGPDPVRLPPHLEVGVRVHAADTADLQRGDFRLELVSVSRGAGVGTGRFLHVLAPQGRAALSDELAALPSADDNTVTAQLSFPPLVATTAHVARSPQVLPTVISMEEHRPPAEHVLTLDDLAVGCDGRRMYLAAPARGHRVEAVGMHALNLHAHTPPLARFLTELSRAQCAQVTMFDWGAARTMPFLPRLRYGRTVVSPARWRLEKTELPARSYSWAHWDMAFIAWQARRRLPQHVYLTEGDRQLALDLKHPGHRILLRAHLDHEDVEYAVLTGAPREAGWCTGRAHEVVVALKASEPPGWPRLPKPTRARIIGRDQGQAPATSLVLLASLYGDLRRQDTILSEYLPALLDRLAQPPWWFVRFRDPDQHLRLRVALFDREEFGQVARTVSAWADELHTIGLLREVRYPTSYPETGRWGSGAAWAAAEDVFRADSRALLPQLCQPVRPHRRALVAAHSVAITSAFLGSTAAGMRWLIDHVPPTAPEPVPRPVFAEAVRLADPSHNWAALRAAPGGAAAVEAWADRDAALSVYRGHLPGPHTQGIDADDVLGSLLHVHFVRAVAVDFPEESICLYLARAAALAWTARTTRGFS